MTALCLCIQVANLILKQKKPPLVQVITKCITFFYLEVLHFNVLLYMCCLELCIAI